MSTPVRNLIVRLRPEAVVVAADQLGREEGPLILDAIVDRLDRGGKCPLGSIAARRSAREVDVAWVDAVADGTSEESPGSAHQAPELVGGALFEAIFGGTRRALFERCRGPGGDPVRVVLEIDPRSGRRAALAALPWEQLYSASEQRFLALHVETPVVRRIPVAVAQRPAPRAGCLRILAIAASPDDNHQLDLAVEIAGLQRLDARRGIKLEILEGRSADLDGIRRTLERFRPHVVHFMGHGSYDSATGMGRLHLVAKDGGTRLLAGTDLATTLREVASLRLVVLNACDTARTSDSAPMPMASVANAIVLAGIPSVIAMQRPIRDDAAIVFATELYARIETGAPVDLAVTLARQAMRTAVTGSEWAIPALFVGDPDQLRAFTRSWSFVLRRAAVGFSFLIAAVYLLSAVPIAEVAFELDLTTSRVEFRLAGQQEIFDHFRVFALSAADLESATLPEGETLSSSPNDRLDLQIARRIPSLPKSAGSGTLTLQPMPLAANTRVALWREDEWPSHFRFHVLLEGTATPLRVVFDGIVLTKRGTADWSRLELESAGTALLEPRDARFQLVADFETGDSLEVRSGVEISEIGFDTTETLDWSGESEVRVVSGIETGRLLIETKGVHDLAKGDGLQVSLSAGSIAALRLGEAGIELTIRGRAQRLEMKRAGTAPENLIPNLLTSRGVAAVPFFMLLTVGAVCVWCRPRPFVPGSASNS